VSGPRSTDGDSRAPGVGTGAGLDPRLGGEPGTDTHDRAAASAAAAGNPTRAPGAAAGGSSRMIARGVAAAGRDRVGIGAWAVAALLLALMLAIGPRGADDGAGGAWILATATTGGTFYPVGVAMATLSKQVLAPETGVSLAAISSAGSEENLKLLRSREAHFAILQGIHVAWAWTGEGRMAGEPPFEELRAVAVLWPNVEHLVVRRSLAPTGTVDDLAGMAGQRFAIGARYSGAEGSARHLFEGLGLDPDQLFDLAYLGYEASADALQNGIVAGMNTPAGAPVGAVTRAMAADGGLVILGFTEEQRRRANGQYGDLWQPHRLPAGTYPNQPEPVDTVAQPNVLVAHADVPEEHVYLITRMLFEHIGFLHLAHAAARQMTPESAYADLPVPYHPGALRYFRERGLTEE
jgi:uncharacterized protein